MKKFIIYFIFCILAISVVAQNDSIPSIIKGFTYDRPSSGYGLDTGIVYKVKNAGAGLSGFMAISNGDTSYFLTGSDGKCYFWNSKDYFIYHGKLYVTDNIESEDNIVAQDDIQADRYLFNNTQKNIYIGEEAGVSYDASGDTASVYIGYNTAQYLNGGGLQAGRNIGIGAYVFQNGGNNTQNSIGIGYKTLRNSSTIGSVCIGTKVAPYIKGVKNFLLGSDNMGVDSNINSSYNVICGNGNLSTNQYNIGNIVLGVQATQISGDTMVHNIISGYQAMRSSSGTHRYNILMGEQNSYESNNMNYMISLGSRATYNCDNSDSSIVIGHYLYSGSTLNNRLCIGMFTKKLIEGWFDLDSAQINGDFNVTGDAYANSFNTDTLRMGGTITIRKTITLADDGTYALPAKNFQGHITCTTTQAYMNFTVYSDGSTRSNYASAGANTSTTDTDGKVICVYDGGDNAVVKNTSGGELTYVISYIYDE